MTRPYSVDLRERAVALVKDGHSRRAVARLLDLGELTVMRWVRRERASGSPAAKPIGGRRRFALLHEQEWLMVRMAAGPDFTLRGLRAELAERRAAARGLASPEVVEIRGVMGWTWR